MPLVGKVGRKSWRTRVAMGVVYLLLILGAITTVTPFLIMATTGFKGPTDQNDNRLIPAFWQDNAELATKYRDDKYAGNMSLMDSTAIGADASHEVVAAYRDFLMTLPVDQWQAAFRTPSNNVTSRTDQRYQAWLRQKYGTLDAVNRAYNEISGAFQQITPPAERFDTKGWRPKGDQKWQDWLEFKATLPAEFRIPLREERLYQEWMRLKFENQFDRVPAGAKGSATKFEELRLDLAGEFRPAFRAEALPATFAQAGSIEDRWAQIQPGEPLPIRAEEAAWVAAHAAEIRGEFTWRNYRYVFDYMAINGRALVNTALFCLLTIAIQLTVNPLAAYALSRFPMKATAKILLFLLATMAFPAEVAMIPSFLLLKELGLLNTFAALVLPAAASGYMIYLLKGFFDSLPQEVFESGQIDGAPEWKMMLKIAFPLSKPVLGYLALLAFMGAYGAFLYAFLVAQDRDMWTLMVFIYQLQQVAPKAVMMAAVTLAALPTLIVFLLCQRVIMRGIVLPGER